MVLSSWFTNLFQPLRRPHRKAPSSRRRILEVEVLEGRLTPSCTLVPAVATGPYCNDGDCPPGPGCNDGGCAPWSLYLAIETNSVNENEPATVNGVYNDSSANPKVLTFDWGDWNDHANTVFDIPSANSLSEGQLITSTDGGTVLLITRLHADANADLGTVETVDFRAMHRYMNDGPNPGNGTPSDTATVTVTLATEGNPSNILAQEQGSITVNNVAPQVALPSLDHATIPVFQAVNLSDSFTDQGVGDTHTATIDWGDQQEAGVVTESNGAGAVTGSHAYTVPGTYTITVTVQDQDGGSQSATTTIQVVKADQTITFAPLANKTYGDAPFTVSASASSGLPVSFNIVAGQAYASISGNTVTILAATPAGTVVTVEATQAGDTTYNAAAPVDEWFTIAKADATVAYSGYSGGTYDGNAHTQTVTVSGVLSDGQLYTTSLTGTNAGNYSQAWSFSNSNYKAVDESGTLAFTIGKASSSVTVTPATYTYDTTTHTHGTFLVSGVGTGVTQNVTWSYVGDQVNAGTYTATATYAGDANHYGSVGSATMTVQAKLLQASAWSQGTINIGSNGVIVLHIAVAGGQLYNSDTVYSLFNGATFTIGIQNADGSTTYGTMTSVAAVNSDGTINVSMKMSDSLRADLYDAYVNGRAVNFAVTATANGGNYGIDADTMSRLLNNGALKYVVA